MTHFNILGDAGEASCGAQLRAWGPPSLKTTADRSKVTCGRCQRTRSFLALKP
jgi:hypothetical protein